jgi:hypothetical protein
MNRTNGKGALGLLMDLAMAVITIFALLGLGWAVMLEIEGMGMLCIVLWVLAFFAWLGLKGGR